MIINHKRIISPLPRSSPIFPKIPKSHANLDGKKGHVGQGLLHDLINIRETYRLQK